jgi:hypothetical protein
MASGEGSRRQQGLLGQERAQVRLNHSTQGLHSRYGASAAQFGKYFSLVFAFLNRLLTTHYIVCYSRKASASSTCLELLLNLQVSQQNSFFKYSATWILSTRHVLALLVDVCIKSISLSIKGYHSTLSPTTVPFPIVTFQRCATSLVT